MASQNFYRTAIKIYIINHTVKKKILQFTKRDINLIYIFVNKKEENNK